MEEGTVRTRGIRPPTRMGLSLTSSVCRRFAPGRFEKSALPVASSSMSSVGLAFRFALRTGAETPTKDRSGQVEDRVAVRGLEGNLTDCSGGIASLGEATLSAELVICLTSDRLCRFGRTCWSSYFRIYFASFSLSFSSSTIIKDPSIMALCTKTYCRRLWQRLIRCSRMSSRIRLIGSPKVESRGGVSSSANITRGSA